MQGDGLLIATDEHGLDEATAKSITADALRDGRRSPLCGCGFDQVSRTPLPASCFAGRRAKNSSALADNLANAVTIPPEAAGFVPARTPIDPQMMPGGDPHGDA